MQNRIEAIRKERGIRQEELAKLLGVSQLSGDRAVQPVHFSGLQGGKIIRNDH